MLAYCTLFIHVRDRLELFTGTDNCMNDVPQYTPQNDLTDYDRMKAECDFYSAADTGYISQNVYLFCASEGLNTVVVGGVNREALGPLLKLKPTQHIILSQPVGYAP